MLKNIILILFYFNLLIKGNILSSSSLSSSSLSSSSLFRGGIKSSLSSSIEFKIPQTFMNGGNIEMRKKFERLCRDAQSSICAALEEIDGKAKFRTDIWDRENGGGGITNVLSGGDVFEKAGVNLAVVFGKMPQSALRAATERGFDRAKIAAAADKALSSSPSSSSDSNSNSNTFLPSSSTSTSDDIPFFACGISSVIHPKNPHCPTMHFNYRYFETAGGVWWFGGGTDITPAYLDEEDMRHFHGVYKAICDKHDKQFYPKFKKWADEYYFIPHRGETRGLGGIFYDDLNDRDPNLLLDFARDGLAGVIPAYAPIINKHKFDSFTPREKQWQQIRRGRYVEFNVIYDRGTIFGLKTGGRIESILMSLPELARWEYDHQPAQVYGPNSPEAKITELFKHPKEWV